MKALQEQIIKLAEEKDVLILSHYYQSLDIQEIAHIVGDSFELARKAAVAPQQTLCVCGVRFMAEAAKILSPDKTVLLPSPDAGCPMADMITPEDIALLRRQHPHAAVVCYVNSSASVKAASDVCCTSSSAVKIARAIDEKEIIFVPDQNLGAFVASQVPEKTVHLFNGCCPVHNKITARDVKNAKQAYPNATFLAHPECVPDVVALADGVGSTAYILQTVERAPSGESFIIGTEFGVVERLKKTAADKHVFPLKSDFICRDMKKTSLEQLLYCLQTMEEKVELDPTVREKANIGLTRMIEIG